MTLKKYEESVAIPRQEPRYEEIVFKDAIDEAGEAVRVVDERRKKVYTESQVDAELAKWQALKDQITALKAAEAK